jgi:hypothetical protein
MFVHALVLTQVKTDQYKKDAVPRALHASLFAHTYLLGGLANRPDFVYLDESKVEN